MNCRTCIHWSLQAAAAAKLETAKAGYGKCQLADAPTFLMAGGYCGQWQEAPAESLAARRKFLAGWL